MKTLSNLAKRFYAFALIVLLGAFAHQSAVASNWTGNTSSDWHTASNWSAGIPTSAISAVIVGGRPNNPVISSADASVLDLDIQSGASLTLQNGRILTGSSGGHVAILSGGTLNFGDGTIIVLEDFTRTGTFNAGTGTIVLNGSGVITGSAAFYNLTVNSARTMQTGSTLSGRLTLQSSTLSSAGNLTLAAGATIERSGGALSGTPVFGASVNVVYTGSSALTTGIELPASAAVLNNLTINNSGTVTLGAARTVNGTLTLTQGTFSNGSNLTMASGSTISRATGTLSSAPTFTSNVNVMYTGATGVTTGNELPASSTVLNNLTINNSGSVTLNAARTVNGTLTFTSGKLILGSNNLTLGSSGSISGPPAIGTGTSNYIVTDGAGVLTINSAGNKLFPIGPTTSSYNPVQVNNTGTSDNFSARVQVGFTGLVAPTDPTQVLNRAWIITEGTAGGSNATLTFQYNTGEYTFPPFSPGGPLYIARYNGTQWVATAATATAGPPHLVKASGFTAFSPFGVTSNTSSLPIQLASFTGTFQNNAVRLNWTTISEVNNYGFYVEKRSVGSIEWWSVENSFVAGHGTTNVPQHYTFTDNAAVTAALQYRLKQVDLDGSIHFTDPIQVDVLAGAEESGPREFALSQNYPNPFNPSTEIKFDLPENSNVSLVVYDVLGRKVTELVNGMKEAGYHTATWNAKDISSGVYFARFTASDASGNVRLSKINKLVLTK